MSAEALNLAGKHCPCRAPGVVCCALCHRVLCGWHHAHNLLGEPACFPRCGAKWWDSPKDAMT